MDEDNSVLKSLFAQITGLKSHFRVDSETRIHQIARERRSLCKAMSRPSSGIRFAGFESFDEVRRGFEFTDERPALYPSPAATRRVPRKTDEATFSIMSVSLYGTSPIQARWIFRLSFIQDCLPKTPRGFTCRWASMTPLR